jgi:hypothetical protein
MYAHARRRALGHRCTRAPVCVCVLTGTGGGAGGAELPQIDHVFSDKTGTLTQNKMVFRRCVIGGIPYGGPLSQLATAQPAPPPASAAAAPGLPLPPASVNSATGARHGTTVGPSTGTPGTHDFRDPAIDFDTAPLLRHLRCEPENHTPTTSAPPSPKHTRAEGTETATVRDEGKPAAAADVAAQAARIEEFLVNLAVCHSVIPEERRTLEGALRTWTDYTRGRACLPICACVCARVLVCLPVPVCARACLCVRLCLYACMGLSAVVGGGRHTVHQVPSIVA